MGDPIGDAKSAFLHPKSRCPSLGAPKRRCLSPQAPSFLFSLELKFLGYYKQLLPLTRTKRNIRRLHLYTAQGVKLLHDNNKWETPKKKKKDKKEEKRKGKRKKFQSELNAEADAQVKTKPKQSTRLCNPTNVFPVQYSRLEEV